MNKEDALISLHKLNYVYLATNKCVIDDWEKIVQLGGLTYPQTKLLIILKEGGQATMSQIAERGLWHMSTVTELVNRMDKEDLLRKQIDQIDKRVVKVDITEKGVEVLNHTKRLYFKNSDIFKGLLSMDKKDLDAAFDVFASICRNTKGVVGPCGLTTALETAENPKCNCLEILNSLDWSE
ncbi:MarR family winged helix-turn-helix transcriptional regulator [Lutispora sp.]|uniref:MarR family winged helix-turn-helix transcriptional regulator n=1 Tax=Lutispora sp. TaxID=2828727 RepID=UPI002B1FE48C|nr:MarR family transcriptional regulator [Lutispora sp.]MEA4961933.1 MarR family transcriptional regulator [Lutispora sp.]